MFTIKDPKNNSNANSNKTVMFNVQHDGRSDKQTRNEVTHVHPHITRHSKKAENIKSELFKLTSRNNLLFIMVYFLIWIIHFYAVLQISTPHMGIEIQCDITQLAKTRWTFYEKRNITWPYPTTHTILEENVGCFYYAFNYSYLALLPYEAALEEVQSTFYKPKIVKCNKYLYKNEIPEPLSLVKQFDLICDRKVYQSYNFFLELGHTISAFPLGIIADVYVISYGRKPVYIFGAVTVIIGSCLIPTAMNFSLLFVGKTIASIGHTTVFLSLLVLFTELCHNKYRSLLTALSFASPHVGTIIHSIIFPAVPTWRMSEIANACPLLIILFGVMFVPESPRWLMIYGKWKTAWKVLQEMGSVEKQIPAQNDTTVPPPSALNQLHIFTKLYFDYRTCITIILSGIVPTMHYVIVTTKHQIVMQKIDVDKPMSAVLLITTILTSGLVFTFRKKNVCCNLFLLLASCFIASVLSESKSISDITLLLAEIFTTALLPVVYIYILDLFPTSHRATAFGVGISTSGIIAMIYLQYQYELPMKIDIHVLRGFFCGFCMMCALLMLVAPVVQEEITDTKEDLITSLTMAELF